MFNFFKGLDRIFLEAEIRFLKEENKKLRKENAVLMCQRDALQRKMQRKREL